MLRVETTINNPREFRTLRVITDDDGRRERRWCPMNKGVSNMWRYFQVGIGSNRRYLDALAAAQPNGEGVAALDALCRSRTRNGRHHARSNPLQAADLACSEPCLPGETRSWGSATTTSSTSSTPRQRGTGTNADDDAPEHRGSSPNCVLTAWSPRFAAPSLPGNSARPACPRRRARRSRRSLPLRVPRCLNHPNFAEPRKSSGGSLYVKGSW